MKKARGRPKKKVATTSPPRTSLAPENAVRAGEQMETKDRNLSELNDVEEEVPVAEAYDDPPQDHIQTRQEIITSETGDKPEIAEQPVKLWTDIIRGNRETSRGMAIEFSAPTLVDGEIEVEIQEDDVESELNFWKNSLIMYVLGGELTMNGVKQFMMKYWNFVGLPEMFYNDEGYFILRFKTLQDKDAVMSGGPYTIFNMTMFLRE